MDNFKKDTIMMAKGIALVLMLILSILCAVRCSAQDWSAKLGVGYVQPIERAFANIEVCHRIAPKYSLSLSTELSSVESNVSPKLVMVLTEGLSLDSGFGWGHRWQKADCSDHNYHTYTLGLMWSWPVADRLSFFVGPSMFWRSYQAHIGLHRGTLRMCAGLAFRL